MPICDNGFGQAQVLEVLRASWCTESYQLRVLLVFKSCGLRGCLVLR